MWVLLHKSLAALKDQYPRFDLITLQKHRQQCDGMQQLLSEEVCCPGQHCRSVLIQSLACAKLRK